MSRNNFGVGLPPKEKNEATWPLKQKLLADMALVPWAEDIEQSWDIFRCARSALALAAASSQVSQSLQQLMSSDVLDCDIVHRLACLDRSWTCTLA